MKFIFIFSLLLFNSYFVFIKSEESSYSLLDFDFKSIDDNILKSFNDFEFAKDKEDIIKIQQKMKKIACLNIITKVIKESKSDIKNQLKAAKNQNKNNFNNFINNMTDTCVFKIKDKDVKQILNIDNFEKKNFPLNREDIKFKEHLTKLLEENDRIKKLEELELIRTKRNKIILNTVFIGVGVLVILFIWNLLRKKKNSNDSDEKKEKIDKKAGHKKKGKKIENKEN